MSFGPVTVTEGILTSKDTELLEFVAHLLLQNGKLEDSLILYEALLKLNPGHSRSLMATCYIYIQLHRPQEALARLQWLATNSEESLSEARVLLHARALVALGKTDEARKMLQNPVYEIDAQSW